MTASDLAYPVLFLYKDLLSDARTEEELTTTTSRALRLGFFNGLRVIDSNGRQYTVTKARFLHGVGRVWGYNIFLGRMIRVALDLAGIHQHAPELDLAGSGLVRGNRDYQGMPAHGAVDQVGLDVLLSRPEPPGGAPAPDQPVLPWPLAVIVGLPGEHKRGAVAHVY